MRIFYMVDIVEVDNLNVLNYEIRSSEIKPYTYRKPIIIINEHAEFEVGFSKHSPKHIKKLVLLSLVGLNENKAVVSYEPMDHVNRFLMTHHIVDDKQESEQYAKGLVHYFSFILELQRKWDEEYDEEEFEETVDLQRPRWDYMALRKSERVTFQYRTAVKRAVLEEHDPSLRIARTTAMAYINAVVKFYSFHLQHGYEFNNPPFDHELITINYQASGTSMKPYLSKQVHTTDMRLKFPRSKRNDGCELPSSRRDLKPLLKSEWDAVETILVTTQRVLKNVSGRQKWSSLSIEYCLFFLVLRYTGLRKEEAASLHLEQIVKPHSTEGCLLLGVGGHYGSLTKTKDGGNKSRRTIIPSSVMQKLYEYTRSSRYQKRLQKFKVLCQQKRDAGDTAFFDVEDGVDETKQYLFLSQTGKPFFTKLTEINTRWNEIRSTVKQTCGLKILGSPHNLRSTFGVGLFLALLKNISPDEAVKCVSECFGHEQLETTLLYLKIAQQAPTGDEIYDNFIDYLGIFEGLDVEDFAYGE